MANIKRARHRKNENDSKRTCSFSYFMDKKYERIRVCKTMFCSTLGMSVRTISKWISEVTDGPEVTELTNNTETLTQKLTPPRKPAEERSLRNDERRLAVKEFFDHLPKLESHYCRKINSKIIFGAPIHNQSRTLCSLQRQLV